MYDNSGKKIKIVAYVRLALGILLSIILALMIFGYGHNNSSVEYGTSASESFGLSYNLIAMRNRYIEKASTITSILVLAIGTFLSWLGSLQLYAFGQLVEDNQKMQKTIDKLSDTIKLIAFKSKNEK